MAALYRLGARLTTRIVWPDRLAGSSTQPLRSLPMLHHDPTPPAVGRLARLLGAAGLLPQLGALIVQAESAGAEAGKILAFGYGSLILSFLGGIWWGFAMHRRVRQRILVVAAIVPSLVPVALVPVAVLFGWRWALVGLAVALMLTLLVDRRLVERGDAPVGWMRLRVPLSAGLATLTLIAAVMR